jgi:hypothetical protein
LDGQTIGRLSPSQSCSADQLISVSIASRNLVEIPSRGQACFKAASSWLFLVTPAGKPSKGAAVAAARQWSGVRRRHPGAIRVRVISFGPS